MLGGENTTLLEIITTASSKEENTDTKKQVEKTVLETTK